MTTTKSLLVAALLSGFAAVSFAQAPAPAAPAGRHPTMGHHHHHKHHGRHHHHHQHHHGAKAHHGR
jgi:Ni/Co efflux regulator RcnB